MSDHLSKMLSYLLRHSAHSHNLSIDSQGFVPVAEIIQLLNVSFADIEQVVQCNKKQRFTLKQEPNTTGIYYIRANQGHSFSVPDLDLALISEPLESCFHGTYQSVLPAILNSGGLSKMQRNHIHMTHSLDSISGIRHSVDALIHIDMKAAMQDGIAFYHSQNNVILTEGDSNGFLSSKYFKKITKRDDVNEFIL